MCLNPVVGLAKAKIENATKVVIKTITTKRTFILRIKGLIYSFNSFLKVNKFFVKSIWATTSHTINKTIIILLILENNFDSMSKPKKRAWKIKRTQDNNPK